MRATERGLATHRTSNHATRPRQAILRLTELIDSVREIKKTRFDQPVVRSLRLRIETALGEIFGKEHECYIKNHNFVDYANAGAQTVIVCIAEAQGVTGMEPLDSLEHHVAVVDVRVVRIRL